MVPVDVAGSLVFGARVKHTAGGSISLVGILGLAIPVAALMGGSIAAADSKTATISAATSTIQVPWGPVGMTLRSAEAERLALGPAAVAVDAQGDALVLDNWGLRVWRIGRAISKLSHMLPRDTEDVIAWDDGALAVYRPLGRSVELFSRDGAKQGSLSIPRAVVDVGLLEAGPSHRVLVEDPFQETVTLGSSAAPFDEASVLRSRKDGVHGGLEVLVRKGRALLRVLDRGERKSIGRQWPLGSDVRGALIIGRAGDIACVRLERTSGTVEFHTARQVVCLDVVSGRQTLRVGLPPPGLYVPRRELALGGTPLTLVHIEPQKSGLLIRRWEVAR